MVKGGELIVDLNLVQYMFFVFLLLMLEAAVTADVFLNRDWEEVTFKVMYLLIFWVNDLLNMQTIHLVKLIQFNVNQDFPEDPSGSFDQFKDFVRLNFHICKLIGLSIVTVQVSSFYFLDVICIWENSGRHFASLYVVCLIK